jgi:hypothetical protein
MSRGIDFLLGLPALRDGPLWRTAVSLGAPVLISANALSRWRRDRLDLRCWRDFDRRPLALVATHPVWLDSAGFVASAAYRGFPWGVDDYLDLCASAPWRGCFSMDLCTEPEIAHDREAVLDRISGTVRLNMLCRNGAERRGILDRLCPVLQGWRPDDYLRCLDRMTFALDHPLIGVGSMCRRHVGGETGILRVVDALDRALGSCPSRLHLFGLKGQGMAAVRGHPRIASVDSQAWGVTARQQAHRERRSKTDFYLAAAMQDWYQRQIRQLQAPGFAFNPPAADAEIEPHASLGAIEARIADAAEQLRRLHETGELDWSDVSPLAAYELAFVDDEDDAVDVAA